MRIVRHHEEPCVAAETRLAQVALRRRALRIRPAGGEEYADVGSACRAENLQRRPDRRIARELIPSCPAAGRTGARVARAGDRSAETIQLDDLPVRQRRLTH